MRAPFAGPSYGIALIWSRSDLRICRNIYWHDTKQRNPIHHIFSAGYLISLANTFTNLSRIPCLYARIWLEPQIGVWLGPRLKSGEWQHKSFPSPQCWKPNCLSDVRWSRFPQLMVWWVTILYQRTGFANTWEVYSIHPIDARAHIGLHHDIEDSQFQLALGAWNCQTMIIRDTRPMSQERTLDGTEKINPT